MASDTCGDGTERSRLVVYCHDCHEAVDVPDGIPMNCPQCLLHNFDIVRHRGEWIDPRKKEWVGYDYSDGDEGDDRDRDEKSIEDTTEQATLITDGGTVKVVTEGCSTVIGKIQSWTGYCCRSWRPTSGPTSHKSRSSTAIPKETSSPTTRLTSPSKRGVKPSNGPQQLISTTSNDRSQTGCNCTLHTRTEQREGVE